MKLILILLLSLLCLSAKSQALTDSAQKYRLLLKANIHTMNTTKDTALYRRCYYAKKFWERNFSYYYQLEQDSVMAERKKFYAKKP